MFEKLDSSGDGNISYKEFTESIEQLKRWGLEILVQGLDKEE